MTLWSGRFKSKLDPAAWTLNASIEVDKRLANQDIDGSIAWAQALAQAGILNPEELKQICAGLETTRKEFSDHKFNFSAEDEDIHTAVERRLGELIGSLAGKLHTGRSRNDQVATDFRLWIMEAVKSIDSGLIAFQKTLIERAESDLSVIMPGYTHLQRAQPILLSHWWLSHFWSLERDRQRFADSFQRLSIMPLGSAALAGTTFDIDRQKLAESLGFSCAAPNSLDAISDRDFATEFLFCCSMVGIHLSHLAEMMIIFTSAEFGFFELSDAYSTGSSLMPQKKNPDLFGSSRCRFFQKANGRPGDRRKLRWPH